MILIVTLVIILSVPTYSKLSVRKKAADLNRDGEINYEDLKLIVQMGYPEAKKNGIEKTTNSGNYIFRQKFGRKGVSGTPGEFVQDTSDSRIYGTYTNSAGKTFTIYYQCAIYGPDLGRYWTQECNRAAAASIVSAYADDIEEPINKANFGGIGYSDGGAYFSKFGLTGVYHSASTFSGSEEDLITALLDGSYVMIHLKGTVGRGVFGASGNQWASARMAMHWISFLDIQEINGEYAVFVADPGWGNTLRSSEGLDTGWWYMSEWEGLGMDGYSVVSE